MKKSLKIITISLTLLLIATVFYGAPSLSLKVQTFFIEKENRDTVKTAISQNKKIKSDTIEIIIPAETEKNKEKIPRRIVKTRTLPESAYLQAQFICQAPLETEANWKYHEESCEEAALLQTYLYETGDTMTKQEANEEILKMIEWQKTHFKGHHDIYAEQLKLLAHEFYQIPQEKIIIIKQSTLEDIKKFIAEGHPVIVPVTSKFLKNPYYEHQGYHMLQVIGYTQERIITNDNGTRRGKDYSYSNENFEKAMKDAGAEIMVLKL